MQNDHKGLKKEIAGYVELPVIRHINPGIIQRNYLQIKQDVQDMIEIIIERLLQDPTKTHLVIAKKK